MKFKSLYKVDVHGNMLGWRIWTDDGIVFTRHGRLDGQIQEDSYVAEETNIGRSNFRDCIDQAEFEADAKWKKQIKYRGYFESQEAALNAGDNTYFGGMKPMKAQKWKDHKHKLQYPLYVQPKLNGLRCIAVCSDDFEYEDSNSTKGVRLYRSGGKQIKFFRHIITELKELMNVGEIWDGELYCHGMPLERISGIVRSEVNRKPIEVEKQLEYHVFDAPKITAYNGFSYGITSEFKYRNSLLEDRWYGENKYIKLVETFYALDKETAYAHYVKFVNEGFEGMMYRLPEMTYKPGKRSYEIQKRKDFKDDDFEILEANEGKGRAKGMAISFTCGRYSDEVGEKVTFEVPMNGTQAYLRELWNNHNMWQGKWVQTRFLNYTVYGKPEIPKGLQIRDKKGED